MGGCAAQVVFLSTTDHVHMHEAIDRVPALILNCDEDINLNDPKAKEAYVAKVRCLACLSPFTTLCSARCLPLPPLTLSAEHSARQTLRSSCACALPPAEQQVTAHTLWSMGRCLACRVERYSACLAGAHLFRVCAADEEDGVAVPVTARRPGEICFPSAHGQPSSSACLACTLPLEGAARTASGILELLLQLAGAPSWPSWPSCASVAPVAPDHPHGRAPHFGGLRVCL